MRDLEKHVLLLIASILVLLFVLALPRDCYGQVSDEDHDRIIHIDEQLQMLADLNTNLHANMEEQKKKQEQAAVDTADWRARVETKVDWLIVGGIGVILVGGLLELRQQKRGK